MIDLHYRIIELCEDSYYEAPDKASTCAELWTAAHLCIEDYYWNHDGWDGWSQEEVITLCLHDGDNGPELGRYSVNYDISPDFSVREEKHVQPAA